MLVSVLMPTGCAPRINPEQALAIDSNFSAIAKANRILESRIEALEKQTKVK